MSIVPAGRGQVVVPLGFQPGYRSTFVVGAEASGGRFTAAIEHVPSGMPHGRHVHRHRDEAFYVVRGELEFSLGDEVQAVGAGGTVFVSRGTAHSFANASQEPAEMLAVWVPGDIEGMYRDWAEAFPSGAAFDRERFVEIWRRYDTEPLDERTPRS